MPGQTSGALVLVWLACAAARWVLVVKGAVHPQIWCNTIAHLDSIVCGGLLALVASKRPVVLRTWLRVILLCGGVGVFALAARFGDFAGARSLFTYPAVAVAACAMIAASLFYERPFLTLKRRFTYIVSRPV